MLYLIGLGLSDETDITVKGLETVKKCSRVYLEAYTSILLVDKSVLVRLVLTPRKVKALTDVDLGELLWTRSYNCRQRNGRECQR
jgi:diphthamide biosynthesis methyltransferase